MAKLCNVEIKDLKTNEINGNTYYTGEIYYLGKKLGFWRQTDEDDFFNFNISLLNEAMELYKEKYFKRIISKYATPSMLMAELVNLINVENIYKTLRQRGFITLVEIADKNWTYYHFTEHTSGQELEQFIDNSVNNFMMNNSSKVKPEINIYRSLNDFNLN